MRSQARSSQSKPILIVRIIKTPIRALCRAKDIYIKGMNNFSTTYTRPMMTYEDANRITKQLPRSLSTTVLSNNRSEDQFEVDLTSSEISMADIRRYIRQNPNYQLRSYASRKGVLRSCSVGMGRIDEDRASSFRNDNICSTRG
ncbi:hypothetical protein SSX86_011395 [Deinandra increscens subsp. villosa]|uniref:Uncharacterized protein n=1 Tax=Deinandra increscens subsp. villosa TaxID=3103831 RepID=A0AAP0D6H3_9ASTR